MSSSSEKLTDFSVTPESNLAHYQKEPDSYSWKKQVDHLGPKRAQLIQKNKKTSGSLGPPMGPRDSRAKANWITWAPSGPRDSRAKPSGSLGPSVAQGIQEQNQVDHLGTQWPKGFKSKTKWITWAPSSPRDSRAKPSGSLGHPVAQGIQEQNQVDHLGTQ